MNSMGVFVDLTGRRFEKLVVLRMAGKNRHGQSMCLVQCDCGSPTFSVLKGSLVTGNTTSCGCVKSEVLRARNTKHGMKPRKHAAPEYAVWNAMNHRCHVETDPAYPRYGGRGITVCDRWRSSFEAFIQDMGRRPHPKTSIERRDNDKGYAPDNCYWASKLEQANNTRTNTFVEYEGERVALSVLCRRLGILEQRSMIQWRLNHGWSLADAVATPPMTPGNPRHGPGKAERGVSRTPST